MFQARELRCDPLQNERHRSAILRVGGVHPRPQHQPQDINEQMAFAARELLRPVVAAHAPDARRLDRLAVDGARARLRVSSLAHPFSLAQGGVQAFPFCPKGTRVEAPSPEVAVDGLLRREVAGEHPPGAAAAHEIEDAIEDRAQ